MRNVNKTHKALAHVRLQPTRFRCHKGVNPKFRANSGNWISPEQTWVCDCINFPAHFFALHFKCEKILS